MFFLMYRLSYLTVLKLILRQREKSSKFKSSKYGDQSAGVQNSADSSRAVLVVWTGANLPNGVFFARISPPNPGDQMPTQQRLVDARIDTSASENRLAAA
jgi:hypothetical protein